MKPIHELLQKHISRLSFPARDVCLYTDGANGFVVGLGIVLLSVVVNRKMLSCQTKSKKRTVGRRNRIHGESVIDVVLYLSRLCAGLNPLEAPRAWKTRGPPPVIS